MEDERASRFNECGGCEEHCPKNISISRIEEGQKVI
jgi:NAD-dependent dihydropyrimidine dehydrogenase PreA subunit